MLEPHVDLVRPALAVLAMRDVDGPVAPAGWRNVAAVPEWLQLEIGGRPVTFAGAARTAPCRSRR